jgi:hypothetical protein
MLTNTGNDFNKVGMPIKGSSYYGTTSGLTTVQVTYNNLTGGFGIQATLSLEPADEDWFWVHLVDSKGNCSVYPFITYPRDPLAPTGQYGGITTGNNPVGYNGDTGTDAYTFVGNFTFLRAVLTRDYITPPPMPGIDGRYYMGQIDRVLISI